MSSRLKLALHGALCLLAIVTCTGTADASPHGSGADEGDSAHTTVRAFGFADWCQMGFLPGEAKLLQTIRALFAVLGEDEPDPAARGSVEQRCAAVSDRLAGETFLALRQRGVADLRPIGALVQLTDLDLASNEVRDLRPLAQLTALRTLDVSHNPLVSLVGLEALIDLEVLQAHRSDLVDVVAVAGLSRLRELSLSQSRVRSLEPLLALEHLDSLSIEELDLASLRGIERATGLRYLWASGNRFRSLAPLKEMRELVGLDLRGSPLRSVVEVASMTKLQVLNLSNTGISGGRGVASLLQPLQELRELYLHGNAISSLKELSGFGFLVSLGLEENRLSELPRFDSVRSFPSLRYLYVSGNRIRDVAPLQGLRRLRVLHLARNRVVSLSPLADLPELSYVNAVGNPLEPFRCLLPPEIDCVID